MNTSALINHRPIEFNKWKGLYSRGKADAIPPGFFRVGTNLQFKQDEVGTRNGTSLKYTKSGIVRFFKYERLNEASRYLILTSAGELFDSLYPANALITNVAFVDFSALNVNNRCYISFHNRIRGLAGSYVYVYEGDGPGTLRFAAGAAPTGFTLGVATSASSGYIETGTYLFAVAFETSSGFITAPGPSIFAQYVAPGNFAIDFSSIPVGPAGTVARWILGTQAITDYDGNQFGYEFFFLPDGRIGNNVDTTLSAVSYFSDELLRSADYLFDNVALIPACLGMTNYGNRVAYWTGDHDMYFSRNGDPEVIDATNGFITVDRSNVNSGITNAIDFRGQFYICKRNATYLVVDNGGDPITWGNPQDVDRSVGTEVFGISRLKDSRASNINRFFIADYSGALAFESGSFRSPALSYNIESIWARINKDYFNLVQVDHDEENQIIYFAVPLDSATTLSHILVANYQEAFDRFGLIAGAGVRWSIWTFPWTITSVSIDEDSNAQAVLTLSGLTGGIYEQDLASYDDDSAAIETIMDSWVAYQQENWIHHFGENLFLQVCGDGDLEIKVKDRNGATKATLLEVELTSTIGYSTHRKLNQVTPKLSVQLRTSGAGDHFSVIQMQLDCKPLWAETPG
jgi:hypothetical protein